MDTTISVIVVSHNEGHNLTCTVQSLLASLSADPSLSFEIIVVDDQSTDGSVEVLMQLDEGRGRGQVTVARPERRLGSARARNFGASRARGSVLIFSDAHIDAPAGWYAPFADALAEPGVGAVGPAISDMRLPDSKGYGMRWCDATLRTEWLGWDGRACRPYPVPILGGCFLAMHRHVFDAVGGFDDGIAVWGMEDAELCLRLWSLGYECRLVPGIEVAHLFRTSFPYQVDWDALLYNQLRVAVTHFGTDRAQRVVECMVGNAAFPAAFARLCASDVWQRRDHFRATRQFGDDWFFAKFGMNF